MHTVRRGGFDLGYDVRGSGPGLLMTHGFAATSSMFAGNVAALATQQMVITWDLRGHGTSAAPDDGRQYSVPLVLDDMIALLDHFDCGRATLLGHSVGGFLSLEFALAHPDRVEALILVDTGPGFRRDEPRAGWNAMAERYATTMEAKGLAGIPAGTELHSGDHRAVTGLIHFARNVLTQRDSSVLDGLPSIAVPTLVIVGANDKAFVGGSEYMVAKIPCARLVVIADAGHAPNIDQPDVFDRRVQEFLSR